MNKQRGNRGKNVIIVLFILGLLIMASGCWPRTKEMALKETMMSLDVSKESIAVCAVRVFNQINVDCQARYGMLGWLKESDGKKQDFICPSPIKTIENQYSDFLISIALRPGHYELQSLSASISDRVGFVGGNCIIPIYLNFDIGTEQIVYLGRIEATMRKKQQGECAAGGTFPLVGQAVTGVSSGTFDVKIVDDYENDMLEFTQRCPSLDNQKIGKSILPPWRRLTSEEIDGHK